MRVGESVSSTSQAQSHCSHSGMKAQCHHCHQQHTLSSGIFSSSLRIMCVLTWYTG